MRHSLYRQIHQVLPVIECHYLHIFRKHILIQVFYFIFQVGNHLTRILSFPHDYNPLYNIIFIHSAHLSQTRQTGFVYIGKILHQNRSAIDVFHYDISQFIQIVNQTDSTNHISLRTFSDNISSYIDITFSYRIIQFQRGNAIINQLVRIHTYLKRLHLPAEAHNIRYAGYRTEITFNHPILNRFQFPHTALVTTKRITEYFSRRSIQRLYFRSYPVRKVGIIQ